ncbi:MAG: type II toxin-antitoxin system RelE/ParE family toxin [Nanoarchaeota archaeon]
MIIEHTDLFKRKVTKIKHQEFKLRVKKQIEKIIGDPEIGKPMRVDRKGTREVYISPYRLSYAYLKEEDRIIFLDLYHKDEQ